MLENYKAKSGALAQVYTIEVQTLPEEVDRILDAVMAVHSLSYGRYQRNASVSAVGKETSQPEGNSTTSTHSADYKPHTPHTYPMVELKISIERNLQSLEMVMDAILEVHHYEQPVIFIREDWVSRANYDPNNENPNRWWSNGRGLPEQVKLKG